MSDAATTAPRKAGKRGRRPAVHRPELLLSKFRTAPAATPPPSGDVTSGITAWGMDGNDEYGDCGPAATDHNQVAKAGNVDEVGKLGGVGPVALYFRYGIAQGEPPPKPDQGVTNSTWLQWLYEQGVIEGFAELNASDADEVHQAMLDFAGVLVGCTLTDDAETDFEATPPIPWNITPQDQPDPNDGHDILLVKYDANGDTFVTWGGLQPATVAWDDGAIDEAWVILTSEDADRAGINLAALQAEIESLGGTESTTPPAPAPAPAPSPSPAPAPAPAPVPAPPDPDIEELEEAVEADVEQLEEDVEALEEAEADQSQAEWSRRMATGGAPVDAEGFPRDIPRG